MATATKKEPAKKPAVAPTQRELVIPEVETRRAILEVRAVSPLIMHAWSTKALRTLEDSQTGKAKQKKGPRNPEEEWRAACYIVPGREDWDDGAQGKYYFPASAFKHAFLYGVGQLDDTRSFPKSRATGWVFVVSDPILNFESLTWRTDIGRNPTQPVYRPQFDGWGCDVTVDYDGHSITLEQVVSLMDRGLFTGGIGEWRPSAPKNKSGGYGRARVVGARQADFEDEA